VPDSEKTCIAGDLEMMRHGKYVICKALPVVSASGGLLAVSVSSEIKAKDAPSGLYKNCCNWCPDHAVETGRVA